MYMATLITMLQAHVFFQSTIGPKPFLSMIQWDTPLCVSLHNPPPNKTPSTERHHQYVMIEEYIWVRMGGLKRGIIIRGQVFSCTSDCAGLS